MINNASAIHPVSVEEMESKRFDLLMSINTRGTFLASKYADSSSTTEVGYKACTTVATGKVLLQKHKAKSGDIVCALA